jgi:hypothetical protein
MGLFDLAFDFVQEQAGKQIIREALGEALSTMESMIGNSGQTTVFNDYVVEAFMDAAQADVEDGWEDVDIGEYMDFMGEIVEEGNNIMADAYDYAAEIGAEDADFSEDADSDEIDFDF